jgi:hypothetical protein
MADIRSFFGGGQKTSKVSRRNLKLDQCVYLYHSPPMLCSNKQKLFTLFTVHGENDADLPEYKIAYHLPSFSEAIIHHLATTNPRKRPSQVLSPLHLLLLLLRMHLLLEQQQQQQQHLLQVVLPERDQDHQKLRR